MTQELMLVTLSVDVPQLGTRIKAAREKSGKSPTAIAAMAEMSVANLYRIEAEDTKSIPWDTLKRLGEALGEDFDAEVRAALKEISEP
ncbi:helix-turn-helix transcriptional regulator [Leptolyngbya sp. CCNP1308]|uniref:helix-turn-helix domain-containing protein n=1 Tax=Leptolyngbya sp. CCNP1308 TaxID=3110255 RepID=UPI002B206806|nr:helix-turn-helix transcriptional regulator [Leptolyngbya sp. CCNP1308]MEA5449678.1 helix-turn-helix transcriptional regulator [Leptolyngbya sp. CCNP1308]